MSKTRLTKLLMIALIVFAGLALLLAIYFLPPVHERLAWRVASLRSQVFYFFNPPGEAVFMPGQQDDVANIVRMTPTPVLLTDTPTLEPSITPTDFITPTPTITPTFTPTPTPIPDAVSQAGVRHEYQSMNNCGPAAFSMALSYWGWDGNQRTAQSWLRPHPDDRNVMPYEMVNAVHNHTNLAALLRWGGDLEIIKQFIAAGFPVLIERDLCDTRPTEDWTGHYGVVTGYDDSRAQLILQDSLIMPDYPLSYEVFYRCWRAFNHVYIVVYPPDKESEVLHILGPHADEVYNHEHAAQKAQDAIPNLQGRDLFFAWFNYGTSLVNLGDYHGAAQAYDYAYQNVYLTIPVEARPWRMLWYQTGPYFAYYHTGRYHDVIEFANVTLQRTGVREIEETWVWRGRARLALGDETGAIEDFRTALNYHPGWEFAKAELRNLGLEP